MPPRTARPTPARTPTRRHTSRAPRRNRPTVTIRNNVASIQVLCGEDIHTVTITRQGTIALPHDREAEEIVTVLGGEPSPCYRVINSYHATVRMVKTVVGLCDPPQMKWSNSCGWYSPVECDDCRTRSSLGVRTIGHYNTPEHLAVAYNGYSTVISNLRDWVAETHHVNPALFNQVHPETRRIIQPFPIIGSFTLLSPDMLLTPRYITLAEKFVGEDPSAICELREKGITVEWLTELARLVSDRKARRNFRRNRHIARAMIASRNIPASEVAAYMNAGVTSHYYTYAREHLSPIEARARSARSTSGTRGSR